MSTAAPHPPPLPPPHPPGVAPAELLVRAADAEALGRSLLDLAVRLREDAGGQLRSAAPQADQPPQPGPPLARPADPVRTADPASLARTVAGLMALRQRRLHHLGMALAGEAAWDILLTLFEARLACRQPTFAQLSAAGFAYPATTRRWITVLAGLGLVEQHGAVTDPGQRLGLTRKGEQALTSCLSGLAATR